VPHKSCDRNATLLLICEPGSILALAHASIKLLARWLQGADLKAQSAELPRSGAPFDSIEPFIDFESESGVCLKCGASIGPKLFPPKGRQQGHAHGGHERAITKAGGVE
jgi:hypothetical protein